MGVKFAHALGAHVVMITTSPTDDLKPLDIIRRNVGLEDVKIDATMVLVGAIEPMKPFHGGGLVMGRKRVAGSLIGGVKETQEMLDFCGEHNIVSDIELINMQDINKAYERVTSSDVKYRFVIDMASLKN